MTSRPMLERTLARERLVLVALMVALFLLAALYILLGAGMEMPAMAPAPPPGAVQEMPGMPDMEQAGGMAGMANLPGATMPGMTDPPAAPPPPRAGGWQAGPLLVTFLMWWVMMVAMMLPAVAPTVLLHAALQRHMRDGPGGPGRSILFLAGYLLVWGGFSALATGLQWALAARGLVSPAGLAISHPRFAGVVLLAAGLYQFLPLKAACLGHCRTPARFLAAHRRPGAFGALVMGSVHGGYCLGCCWALMGLLLVGGVMNLLWIVLLALAVAAEKLLPFGPLAGRVIGAGLLAWGGWLLLAG